ncbi:MAG: M14 family zinc carboxypeptidase [Fidelibacterota bacterium]
MKQHTIRCFSFGAGLLLLLGQLYSVEIYQSLRVYGTDIHTLGELNDVGIPLDHVRIKKGAFIDVIASRDQADVLRERGIIFDVLISNMTEYYLKENVPAVNRDFELGSMKGNYTFDEVIVKMDSLRSLYPDIVSIKDSIGHSMEGRPIWALKVSDNPNLEENEPEVLFTGLTHAREPLGMMNQFYFIQWLCENYNSDPVAQHLVDNRELWFIPVINPDGYVYNESIAPNGGGMHRKNRRDTNCGVGTQRGIDLNRNYGYEWGADNSGSSPDPCSSVFRGDSAFSEPETQAVRDFILAHEFSNVLHYHSYSNVLIHSWGDGTLPDEPDLTTIREIGKEMTRLNGYGVGTGYETIGYGVNGDAVDWTYGTAGPISYTPEIGSYQDNFWPSENRVIPLCRDQLYANQVFGFVGGADFIVHGFEILSSHDDTIKIDFAIQNRGLQNSDGDVLINVSTNLDSAHIINFEHNLGILAARESAYLTVSLINPSDITNGNAIDIILTLNDNSSYVRKDTVTIITGNPSVLFLENAEKDLSNWTASKNWDIVLLRAYSGDHVITDSPNGNYGTNISSSIMLNTPINFVNVDYPFIQFSAKWAIESNWDFVRFQASIDGSQWTSLGGLHTERGAGQGAQNAGDQGYDGVSDWVDETIDLSAFSGESQVYFRFILTSDGYIEDDGFYFDDFTINGYLDFLPGDVNHDGILDIIDVLTIMDFVMDNTVLNDNQNILVDVNFDGQVDLNDPIRLINIILSK